MIAAIIGISSGLLVISCIAIFKRLDKTAAYALLLTGIGFLYVGYTWSDPQALVINAIQANLFLLLSYFGLKKNNLFLIAGYFLHGLWDLAYDLFPVNGLIPPHYDLFCLSVDFTIGFYLLIVLKIKCTMPAGLNPYYKHELDQYRIEIADGSLQAAWNHLERAHIIGQAWFMEHTYVHWLMLRYGFKIKSPKEILGQLPRLLFGGIKSFVRIIPVGNTGGANVPPLRVMEIPEDLQKILKPYRDG